MKVIKHHAARWEEENWRRYIEAANLITTRLGRLLKIALIALNMALYAGFQAAKLAYLLLRLVFLTEAAITKRVEREERWIFRHY